MNNSRNNRRWFKPLALAVLVFCNVKVSDCLAQGMPLSTNTLQPTGLTANGPNTMGLPMGIKIQFEGMTQPGEMNTSIKILLLMTVLSLLPSIFIMTTSFTRIIIVFGFLRQAIGVPTIPPNQVLVGMSLFLTLFIMAPVWKQVNTDAIQPYLAQKISQEDAWQNGIKPLHAFMMRQTGRKELALFLEISGNKIPEKTEEIGLEVLIPAFMMSEIKTAFQMGFLIYLPFLVIDLVVSVSLMSMGMMMLPPMMISLPIKILFFILADGWTLLVRNLVMTFMR
jgi:flagellar biosynthetic protein FliP